MKRVFSFVLALLAVQMMFAAKVAVTNTSDDVGEEGSLRWACKNATAKDTIVFKFDKDGYKTIHISSSLSTVASIDGSTWNDQIIIDGYDEENGTKGKFNGFDKIGPFIKKLIVINCNVGISVYDSKNPQILNCYICDNNIGIKNSNIIANISECLISGNDSVGVLNLGEIAILSNNIIGLSEDQKSAYPNGTGVYSQGRGVKFGEFTDNVVSGNSKNGIEDLGDNAISVFSNNYIGTNKFFDKDEKLGNVENGFVPNSGAYGSYPVFSDNYFGNNGGYAIYRPNYSGSVTLKNNYIGITPDGSAMPNGKGGVLWGALTLTLEDCKIGYNKGSGIIINTAGRNLIVKGGTVAYNKGNGIDISSDDTDNLTVEDVIFDSNSKSAISVDLAFKYNKSYKSLLTGNKFLHTVSPAFSTTKPYPVPEFSSCKITEKTIELVGKVDTAVKAKIELFYTPQGEQTAMMLVDSFYTKADGTFSVSLDRSKLADKSIIGFAATATYNKYNTSPLSSVVYPEIGKIDLTLKEFYVKMDGMGDGSSWEKAMSPQSFAYYLPQVKDGSTFHVAEGRYLPVEEDKSGYKEFKINSSVSIIGGYSKNAKTGDASDPKRYKTIFTGDPSGDDSYYYDINKLHGSYLGRVNDPSGDDINMGYLFNADAASKLYIYGCGLNGGTVLNTNSNDLYRYVTSPISANFIKLEKCEFDVVGTTWAADKSKASRLEASECIFKNRPSCSSPSSIFSCDTLKVEKSLFESMDGHSGGCFARITKAIFIENSTFNDIVSSSTLYGGGKLSSLHLLNNTFNNLSESGALNAYFAKSSNAADIKIIGNIFVNCSYSAVIDNVPDSCEVRNNLCSGNTVGTDLDLQAENLETVLEWDSAAPVLKDNGGFTPTIALKNDFLSDGTPIRFSRLANITTDQRGVSRLDSTCIGAYEIGCENVMIFTVDTVLVGSKLYGQTFTKVGAHDTIVENIHSLNGCDSIITHVVIVIPDQKVLNYYVKTKKAGKGDGSSWENAMDGEMFAQYLPFVSEGTTFHVAEGRYLPVNEDKNGNKEFKVNSSVSVIGGYPNNAKTGESSDPKRYKTIFTGDPSGDDSYIVDGRTSGSYLGHIIDPSNDDINVEALFNADATSKLYFYGCGFKGVTVKYDYDEERHVSSPIYANSIKLEKCEFDVVGTTWAADKSKASRLEASECIFKNRPSCSSPSSIFSCDTLKVEKSLFESMDGHSGGCFARITKAIFIENSTFNDIVSSSTLYGGGKLSSLHLLNNTFNNLSESGALNAYFAKSSNAADIKIIGNIFVNCSYSAVIDNVPDSCEVRNNLCSGNTVGTDLDLQAENLETVLEWDSAAPVLKDNGGFTPTIALKKDVLSDGTSIRFPRLAKITTDQRGVSRLDNTCMGAYEKEEETGVNEVNDTVCEVYPNPVKDVLNVSGCGDSFSYEIVDLTGRTVARGKSVGTIGVSELSNGVYLLNLHTEKQQACVRFVKQ